MQFKNGPQEERIQESEGHILGGCSSGQAGLCLGGSETPLRLPAPDGTVVGWEPPSEAWPAVCTPLGVLTQQQHLEE